ncbi:hypothetical protein CR513_44632, partial [Mucuna pruriens]
MGEVKSFHGIASFYKRFLKYLSTHASPQNEIVKKSVGIGIKVVILQEGHVTTYFSEKLKGAQLNYFTYDRELYAHVKGVENLALKHLRGNSTNKDKPLGMTLEIPLL